MTECYVSRFLFFETTFFQPDTYFFSPYVLTVKTVYGVCVCVCTSNVNSHGDISDMEQAGLAARRATDFRKLSLKFSDSKRAKPVLKIHLTTAHLNSHETYCTVSWEGEEEHRRWIRQQLWGPGGASLGS